MGLQLVRSSHYAGNAGVEKVKQLEASLNKALASEDWDLVRELDQCCSVLIDEVIAANADDKKSVAQALNELKGVYASLIVRCKYEVASMAH